MSPSPSSLDTRDTRDNTQLFLPVSAAAAGAAAPAAAAMGRTNSLGVSMAFQQRTRTSMVVVRHSPTWW